jgi:hypothetical protein
MDEVDRLEAPPDFADIAEATGWLEASLAAIERAPPEALLAAPLIPVMAPEADADTSPLSPLASAPWRRFALAALLADWASYRRPRDRVDFPRLLHVLWHFPRGFRVWLGRLGQDWLPVGYTGWYPIAPELFRRLSADPASIGHRGAIVSLPEIDPAGAYAYLFNYSIVPPLRHTAHSASLIKALAQDIAGLNLAGAAAITLSADGARIAERFGLSHVADISVDAETEAVYAATFPTTTR